MRVLPSALVEHRRAAPVAAGPSMPRGLALATGRQPLCVLNGRFYAQPVTGVQRYGREIVKSMATQAAARGAEVALALPKGAVPPPLSTLTALAPSKVAGHLWEQAVLPWMGTAPLLNLCNTGPVARRRQVVCLHDANTLTQPGSYGRAFRLFYRVLHPLLARRSAVVATVSEASARDLAQHLGLHRSRIAVLPNGHEHALGWRVDTSVLDAIPGWRPFVLLLGSRARHKNVGLLLRLATALDELGVDLVVTGGHASIFTAERPLPSASNVHRLGPVTDDQLAGLMSQALCLAFPSWTEGFGLPIVEAMARGCPVVASDRASMPEVCGDAALMAPPDVPEAWYAAIEALLRSPGLRADLVGRGTEHIRRFSWTASARGYLDLLERLA